MDGNNYGDSRRGRGGYSGYPHGGDRGDDQQQQQRGYMQGYPGYGQQQQQMQAYGQQQGGYPAYAAAYANAYAGYAPSRGGYTAQQMAAYQQAYYGQYANMYNQQQRQQYGGYGGRGGYRGAGGRGGARGGYPGGDMYQQRGRGGAGGRGGYGVRAPRQEILVVVHTDSFATLNTVSRAGSMLSLVPQRVLETRPQVPHVLRILVVVGKRYLAASVSEPKENQDIILSEETATKFLNVENVLCDEGNLFVDLESGDKLARNLYGQLRLSLVQIVSFDKPEPAGAEGEAPADADVFSMSTETLMQEMSTRKSVFAKVEEALQEDSERATKLFEDLLRLSSGTLSAAATAAAEPAEAEGEDAQSTATPAAANNTTNNNAPRRTHMLLRSPQGVRLLKIALGHASKREVFFRRLQEEGEEVGLTRAPAHTAPEGTLFLTLCSSVLTSSLVFHCFGLETKLDGIAQPIPEWADRSHIIDVVCARIASEGILLLRSNGGSCMINALVRRLCPGFRLLEAPRSERRAAAGMKRGRGDEPTAESTEKVARTEDGAASHTPTVDGGVARAPASLDGYEVPVPPQDWRFFHACAAAFVEGRIPEKMGGAVRRDNNYNNQNQSNAAQNPTPPTIVTLKADEITLENRISLLTDHIISCRAIQVLLPHFADAILTFEKSGATSESDFVRQCTTFLNALTQRGKELMLHAFGNYVAQSLITELVPRAIPNTRVETVLNTLTQVVESNIVELSAQKCASNVVERAIALSEHFPQGIQFVVDVTKKILEGDDKSLMDLATSQYANYVVSLLGKKLSSISSTAANAAEALAVEKQLYSRLNQNMNQLQNSRFSSGLLNWMTAQQARLKE